MQGLLRSGGEEGLEIGWGGLAVDDDGLGILEPCFRNHANEFDF